jgi:hypothetical protein
MLISSKSTDEYLQEMETQSLKLSFVNFFWCFDLYRYNEHEFAKDLEEKAGEWMRDVFDFYYSEQFNWSKDNENTSKVE